MSYAASFAMARRLRPTLMMSPAERADPGVRGGKPGSRAGGEESGIGRMYRGHRLPPRPRALGRRFQNQGEVMKCVICKTGETRPGKTTVTLHRGQTTVLIKATPADICQNCGEYYLTEEVARNVYENAEAAARRQAELEILHYAA
jgi:YgiT-type zinc finger domain-containing protein